MRATETAIALACVAALGACAPPGPVPESPANLALNIPGCRTVPNDLICPGEPVGIAACQDGTYYLYEDGRRERMTQEPPPAFKVLGKNEPPRACAASH